jgi:hypothetical protein
MEVPGMQMGQGIHALDVAGLGTTIRGIAGLRAAVSTTPRTATTTTVFVWSATSEALPSPLLFCPLALCWREAPKIFWVF